MPTELATKFVERFPEIASQAQGSDPKYVAWYSQMLRDTEPNGLVFAYCDWGCDFDDGVKVGGFPSDARIQHPPPPRNSPFNV